MASLGDRMIRAAKLDRDLYEEVEADTGASDCLGQIGDWSTGTFEDDTV